MLEGRKPLWLDGSHVEAYENMTRVWSRTGPLIATGIAQEPLFVLSFAIAMLGFSHSQRAAFRSREDVFDSMSLNFVICDLGMVLAT